MCDGDMSIGCGKMKRGAASFIEDVHSGVMLQQNLDDTRVATSTRF